LNLRDDNVKSQGMTHITNVLKDTKFLKLKQLDISGNELNAGAMTKFAKWIVSAAPNLEELSVDDNEFGSDGAVALASIIKQLPSLKKLSCSVCEISGNGGIAIAK
jgi:Ran GTPase-activating protein (RanGAP) involved in mRNA processing and transport